MARRRRAQAKVYLLAAIASLCILAIAGCDSFFYRMAKNKDTAEAYQEYLDSYPDGKHRSQALRRIEDLEFARARDLDTAEAYQAYLSAYPEGRWKVDAQDSIDRIAFEKAAKQNTVEALHDYLESFPEGIYISQTWDRIIDLRAQKALAAQDLDPLEKFLADFPHDKNAPKIERRLVQMLALRYKKLLAGGKQDDQGRATELSELEEKIREHARAVFIKVRYEGPFGDQLGQDYLAFLKDRFSSSGFQVCDSQDDADILVRLSVKESLGLPYLNNEQQPIGAEVRINGKLTVRHLILEQDLISQKLKYWPPFEVQVTIKEAEPDIQKLLRQHSVKSFLALPHMSTAASALKLLLGDITACAEFYDGLITLDPARRQMARQYIEQAGCHPADPEEVVSWSLETGQIEGCEGRPDLCAAYICDMLLEKNNQPSPEATPPIFDWLTKLGDHGTACLCRLTGETMIYDGIVGFSEARAALMKMEPLKARACLESLTGQDTPAWLSMPAMKKEKLRYGRRMEILKKSMETLEAPPGDGNEKSGQ